MCKRPCFPSLISPLPGRKKARNRVNPKCVKWYKRIDKRLNRWVREDVFCFSFGSSEKFGIKRKEKGSKFQKMCPLHNPRVASPLALGERGIVICPPSNEKEGVLFSRKARTNVETLLFSYASRWQVAGILLPRRHRYCCSRKVSSPPSPASYVGSTCRGVFPSATGRKISRRKFRRKRKKEPPRYDGGGSDAASRRLSHSIGEGVRSTSVQLHWGQGALHPRA